MLVNLLKSLRYQMLLNSLQLHFQLLNHVKNPVFQTKMLQIRLYSLLCKYMLVNF